MSILGKLCLNNEVSTRFVTEEIYLHQTWIFIEYFDIAKKKKKKGHWV